MSSLPPEHLPPLKDPMFGDKPGPYATSDLRDVVGTRANPDAIGWYKRREILTRPECPAKTCGHPELEGWLGDVSSFDPRAPINQPPLADWQFTTVLPRIVVWGESLPFDLEPATYMIDYPYLHSNPTTLPNREWVNNLRDRFPEGSKLLLSFFGSRPLTMGLWTQLDFWYAEFLDNFDGIIMPDFSAFSDDPYPQMLFGERMQQVFAREGSQVGRPVIPSIAWTSEDSLRRQIELWTSQAPKVNTILLDCYGSGVDRNLWTWRWLYAIEKYCTNKPYIRWIIAGVTSGWAIRELNELLPDGNFCLVPSVSAFVSSTSRVTDKTMMARKFRRKLAKLEDFKSGREVAEKATRPDTWPTFADALRV